MVAAAGCVFHFDTCSRQSLLDQALNFRSFHIETVY
jgi:hypothetical protein